MKRFPFGLGILFLSLGACAPSPTPTPIVMVATTKESSTSVPSITLAPTDTPKFVSASSQKETAIFTPSPSITQLAKLHQQAPDEVQRNSAEGVTYERKIGTITQIIHIKTDQQSYGDKKPLQVTVKDGFTDQLADFILFSAYLDWQNSDWEKNGNISFDDYLLRYGNGEDLHFVGVDTHQIRKPSDREKAEAKIINPSKPITIVLSNNNIGFVFAASTGLALNQTIYDDGSSELVVPLYFSDPIKANGSRGDFLSRFEAMFAHRALPVQSVKNNRLDEIFDWVSGKQNGGYVDKTQHGIIEKYIEYLFLPDHKHIIFDIR